jgi:site-specific DNA recombinase
MPKAPTTGLRFATFIRVSTERQEEQGGSLATQTSQITNAITQLGARVVAAYGGQEHGTAEWEKGEFDRMLADAAKGRYDAIMVYHPDRWSRDQAGSALGLDTLTAHGIRYFVLADEKDLHDPAARLELGIHAVIGGYQAALSSKKSVQVRIDRARLGFPTCGNVPYARIFTWSKDRQSGTWSLDEARAAQIRSLAERYIAGESLDKMALEVQMPDGGPMSYITLLKVLTQDSGPTWQQRFRAKRFGIDETVETAVPALLPPEVIAAVLARVQSNKTYTHGQSPAGRKYVLARMIFCSSCGRALHCQTNHKTTRWYRHPIRMSSARTTPCDQATGVAWVNADDIEDAVLRDLFALFGNAERMRKAAEQAIPDADGVAEKRRELASKEAELKRIAAQRANVIDAVAEGTLSKDDVKAKLSELDKRAAAVRERHDALVAELANVPTAEEIHGLASRVSSAFTRYTNAHAWARDFIANGDFSGMTDEEKRSLAQMVFAGKTPQGKRYGVYVVRAERGETVRHYAIVGKLVELYGRAGTSREAGRHPEDGERGGAVHQDELLDGEVGSLAGPGPSLWRRRSTSVICDLASGTCCADSACAMKAICRAASGNMSSAAVYGTSSTLSMLLPKKLPFFSRMPMTRKRLPSMVTWPSIRPSSALSLRSVSRPRTHTQRRFSVSRGPKQRPFST